MKKLTDTIVKSHQDFAILGSLKDENISAEERGRRYQAARDLIQNLAFAHGKNDKVCPS
jgi:hypothetical protein